MIRKQSLVQAKVLICESNGSLRQAVRNALTNLGIHEAEEANGYGKARQSLEMGGFDVVVLAAALEGRDGCALLREVRHGRLGPDPFIVAVTLLPPGDPAGLRRAVDSGTDDLLLIPFPVGQLANRLEALATRRKPFVVTHDYIGPDRRSLDRPQAGAAAVTLDAPNPLAARVAGTTPEQYARMRVAACQSLRLERIKRLAVATEWECRRLIGIPSPSQDQGRAIVVALGRMERMLDELVERLPPASHYDRRPLNDLRGLMQASKGRAESLNHGDFDALHAAARRVALTYTRA